MAARKKKPEPEAAPEAPAVPFEKALETLESIVRRLESESLGIEEAMAEYEKGLEALRACRGILDRAERRLEVLVREEGGKAETRPFVPEGGAPPPEAPGAGGKRRMAAERKSEDEDEDGDEGGDEEEDDGDGDGDEESGPPDATSKKDGYLF